MVTDRTLYQGDRITLRERRLYEGTTITIAERRFPVDGKIGLGIIDTIAGKRVGTYGPTVLVDDKTDYKKKIL